MRDQKDEGSEKFHGGEYRPSQALKGHTTVLLVAILHYFQDSPWYTPYEKKR